MKALKTTFKNLTKRWLIAALGLCMFIVHSNDAKAQCAEFADMVTIFTNNGCTGCHGTQGGLTLSDFNNVTTGGNNGTGGCGSYADPLSFLIGKVDGSLTGADGCGGAMPGGTAYGTAGMSAADIACIQTWIDAGAPEFASACPDGIYITEFVYDVCNSSDLGDGSAGAAGWGEYMIVTNSSTDPIDIGDAIIDDLSPPVGGGMVPAGTVVPAGGCVILAQNTQAAWESEYGPVSATGCTFVETTGNWPSLNNGGDMIGITGACNNGTYTDLVGDGEAIVWNATTMMFEAGPAVSINPDCAPSTACNLVLGTITAVCDSETAGTANDTYTATIAYTGGGTDTYTITPNDGAVDATSDNPDATVAGNIVISGVTEGTDLIFNITSVNGCDLPVMVTTPTCEPDACDITDISAGMPVCSADGLTYTVTVTVTGTDANNTVTLDDAGSTEMSQAAAGTVVFTYADDASYNITVADTDGICTFPAIAGGPIDCTLPTAECGTCTEGAAGLVITELSYDPAGTQGNDGDCEYIELFNSYSNPITTDASTTVTLSGGTSVSLPAGITIAPGEYIILTGPNFGGCTWATPPPAGTQIIDAGVAGTLGNGGEDVTITLACADDAAEGNTQTVTWSDGTTPTAGGGGDAVYYPLDGSGPVASAPTPGSGDCVACANTEFTCATPTCPVVTTLLATTEDACNGGTPVLDATTLALDDATLAQDGTGTVVVTWYTDAALTTVFGGTVAHSGADNCITEDVTLYASVECVADDSVIPAGETVITVYPDYDATLVTITNDNCTIPTITSTCANYVITADAANPTAAPTPGNMADFNFTIEYNGGPAGASCFTQPELVTNTCPAPNCPIVTTLLATTEDACNGGAPVLDDATLVLDDATLAQDGTGTVVVTWYTDATLMTAFGGTVAHSGADNCATEDVTLYASVECVADGSIIPAGETVITVYPDFDATLITITNDDCSIPTITSTCANYVITPDAGNPTTATAPGDMADFNFTIEYNGGPAGASCFSQAELVTNTCPAPVSCGACTEGAAGLVITELSYDPAGTQGNDADCEYIELFNSYSNTITLDANTTLELSNGASFTFPAGTTIAPGEYIIIAINPTNFGTCVWATPPPAGTQIFGPTTGSLANAGESVDITLACASNPAVDFTQSVAFSDGTTPTAGGGGDAVYYPLDGSGPVASAPTPGSGDCVACAATEFTCAPGCPTDIDGMLGVDMEVCSDDPAVDLMVSITGGGTGPYTVTYNDGTMDIIVTGYNDGDVITVSPTTTTTYTLISITDANGCTGTISGTALITVTDPPSAGTAGTATACSNAADGNTIVDLDGALGGMPDAFGVWNEVTATNVSLANTMMVDFNGIAPGTYTFTYTVPPNGLCEGAMANVVVTVTDCNTCPTDIDGVLSGDTEVCSDDTATDLMVTIGGGGMATYTIVYNDGVADQTVAGYNSDDPISVSPTANTTYTIVSITDMNGCTGTVSGTATVTVNTAANAGVSGVANACNDATEGTSVVDLEAALGGGQDAGGAWMDASASGADISTPTAVDFDGLAAGTYTFTYTVMGTPPCSDVVTDVVVTVTDCATCPTDIDGVFSDDIAVCSDDTATDISITIIGGGTGPYTITYTDGVANIPVFNYNSGDPISVSPSMTTTYTILSIVDVNSCTDGGVANSTVTVLVNDAANAGTNGTASACDDSTEGASVVDLAAALGGGQDAGGVWTETTASGASLANPNAVDFNGLAVGTYTFTYTVTGVAPCANATANVVVTVTDCVIPPACTSPNVPVLTPQN